MKASDATPIKTAITGVVVFTSVYKKRHNLVILLWVYSTPAQLATFNCKLQPTFIGEWKGQLTDGQCHRLAPSLCIARKDFNHKSTGRQAVHIKQWPPARRHVALQFGRLVDFQVKVLLEATILARLALYDEANGRVVGHQAVVNGLGRPGRHHFEHARLQLLAYRVLCPTQKFAVAQL